VGKEGELKLAQRDIVRIQGVHRRHLAFFCFFQHRVHPMLIFSPVLNATLAGIAMPIAAPQTSAMFGQASVTGTLRLAKTAYVYGQLSGEVRGNETLGGISGGVRVSF
jgi:hypothetical protein